MGLTIVITRRAFMHSTNEQQPFMHSTRGRRERDSTNRERGSHEVIWGAEQCYVDASSARGEPEKGKAEIHTTSFP
nr:hypothetical protein Q903MT_gene3439 [Picea sitchensis]